MKTIHNEHIHQFSNENMLCTISNILCAFDDSKENDSRYQSHDDASVVLKGSIFVPGRQLETAMSTPWKVLLVQEETMKVSCEMLQEMEKEHKKPKLLCIYLPQAQ